MGVRLVALDIDGTIVPGSGASMELPTERLRLAVRALIDSGIVVVVASGRMFPGTSRVARFLGLETPIISQQGCAIHLPDGTITHQTAIDPDLASEVIAVARQLERPYEWFNPLRYIVSLDNEASRNYARVSGIEPEFRAHPERSGLVPTGVGIISSPHEAGHIHGILVSRFGGRLHLSDFPAVTVALAPDANKGHALSMVCAEMGIERHDVLAIGDSVNDATMLAWSGRGIAMAHSDRYALQAADEVLAEDTPEPVAALLEGLIT